MIEGTPSRTAMMTAVARGVHRLRDEWPFIVDDPYGLLLIGPDWRSIVVSEYSEDERARVRAFVLARQRFAEDRLLAGDFPQYVMLGAGLDSFVWRRPDAARRKRVIEIDHPSTQSFKRARAEALGLTTPKSHSFLAVDFERETLKAALDRGGFNWSAPAFFTWIGVTMYISRAATAAVLPTVAKCAPGSEIVFTYAPASAELGPDDLKMRETFRAIAARAGESVTCEFGQDELKSLLADAGLQLAANPTREDIIAMYFRDRSDGLAPYQMERVAAARVG